MELRMMSRVHRERVLLVGGQRALVMQLAHPKVAAGVAQHSDFPARAMDRLRRTLDLTLATVYGTDEEARAAADSIRAVHDRVTGVAEGDPYDANDPALLQWVNATLIDTTLLVYERFVRRLTEAEAGRYYDETRESAVLFGIPEEVVPPDLGAFRRYVKGVLRGPELRATPEGRRLVRDVLRPPLPLHWRVPTEVVRLITLALLPGRVRDLFGLRAGPVAGVALAASSLASRAALPLLPPALREFGYVRGRRRG
jgi:uncharacterized protein (DUF2236 family)